MELWRKRSELVTAIRFLGVERGRYLLTMSLCNVIGSVCYNIVLAIIMQKVLDGIACRNTAELMQGAVIALASFVIAFVFEPVLGKIRNNCVRRTILRIRERLFYAAVGMPVHTYEEMEQGDIFVKITDDVETLEQVYLRHLPNLNFALVHGGIAILLMFFYDRWLGGISLLLGMIQTGINYITGNTVERATEKRQQSRSALLQRVLDTINGQQDIRSTGSEDYFEKRFTQFNQRLRKDEKSVENRKMRMENTVNFFDNFNYIAVMGVGLYMVLKGDISLGSVVAIISLQGNAAYLFSNLSSFLAGIAESLPSLGRIADMLAAWETQPAAEPSAKYAPADCGQGTAIEMRHVTFGYQEHKDVIKNLDFSLRRGELAVITGKSGEGKSTWIKLLMGFYVPASGEYLLYGRDVRSPEACAPGRIIAYVDQESRLFRMTVRENIRMGRADASDEEILAACRAADAHAFIETLPDGYDTLLLNGENLSGGQRQRLALARAFVSKKPVLVIDEGTANLDPLSEQNIIQSVYGMRGQRTILVITHRDAWFPYADQIYRLQDGRLLCHPV